MPRLYRITCEGVLRLGAHFPRPMNKVPVLCHDHPLATPPPKYLAQQADIWWAENAVLRIIMLS